MIQSAPYFIVRTPLLAFEAGAHVSENDLKKAFSLPLLKEALLLASPSLYDRLSLFLRGELSASESRKISLSLRKYLLRISSRCTPFGLFAGISKGTWSTCTVVRMENSLKRCTRLDTDYVSILVDQLLQLPEVADKVKFFPNTTLYSVGEKMRYVEYKLTGNRRTYQLSDVGHDPYLLSVLDKAREGSDKSSLARSITSAGISYEEALEFVEEIIANHLLVSELEIRLTGLDYFSHVCAILSARRITLPGLEEIEVLLKTLDQQTPDENLPVYPALISKLEALTGNVRSDHYIQVDTRRDAVVEIHQQVAGVIEKIVPLLGGLLPPRENKTLENFRKIFFERYESETVDLCIALDPEIGIGYPPHQPYQLEESSLLSEICFKEQAAPDSAYVSSFQQFMIGKYSEALQRQSDIVLDESALQPFLQPLVLPASLYAFVSLHAPDARAIDDGNFTIHFNSAHGPSAATLIARFAHLDEDLSGMLKETLRQEEDQAQAIYAEIVHANQPRTGNISTRPVLRDYEIPILAASGVDEGHTIPVSDLTLAIRGKRIVLHSKKLDREVIPRLSSAHNYSHDTISLYRFLCDLQYQGVSSSVAWDWGVLKSAPYLPRVVIDKVILASARWRLSPDDISALTTTGDLAPVIRSIRDRRGIPQRVMVGTGDNKIPVDLENSDHLPVFQKLIESTDVLEECLFSEKTIFMQDNEGSRYTQEIIVPLLNLHREHIQEVTSPVQAFPGVTRSFTQGSEWLYYKIYCSVKAADIVLLEVIKPFVTGLMEERVIDKWFFIRYTDAGGNHIRLRLHGEGIFYQTVIGRLEQAVRAYRETGTISGLVLDTYKREIERYGPQNIVTSESLFFADSKSILEIMAWLGDNDQLRWQVALLMIDQLFEAFDIAVTARKKIAEELRQDFFKEMNADQELKKSLASVWRNNSRAIALIFNGRGLTGPLQAVMEQRMESLLPIGAAIRRVVQGETIAVPVHDLLKSYIHMSLNRLMRSNPRHHEMVLYDFLYQFYNSHLEKMKREA